MIDEILIISCEHQRYRRAANLAFLEFYGYELKIVDVIWGMHANEHTKEEINDSLHRMIGRRYPERMDDKTHVYAESAAEVYIRALAHITETRKNTLILEDDHFLTIEGTLLTQRLEQLNNAVGNIGVVQLYSRGPKKSDRPEIAIPGAEHFMRGSVRSSKVCNFWTPTGAEKYLEIQKHTNGKISPENALYDFNEDWIFSTLHPEQYAFSCGYIEGDSIGYYYAKNTEPGKKARRTPRQMETAINTIERFKL